MAEMPYFASFACQIIKIKEKARDSINKFAFFTVEKPHLASRATADPPFDR